VSESICHMTHIRNLPLVLTKGGLWCDRETKQHSLTQQEIGHAHIKERRSRCPVTVGPCGLLWDYVPFYFHHHSPMLYAIYRGGVDGYAGGQGEVIYLTSSTDLVGANDLPFVFTDGSAVMALTEQYQDLSDLNKLDWTTIRATYWTNTQDDGDRTRRKQAEFLVYDYVPWPVITGIVVKTQAMADQVAAHLQGQSHIPKIQILPAWYY